MQLFANYKHQLQHYWWILDPEKSSNTRCEIYQTYDPGLGKLREIISRPHGKGRDGRDFEIAVAWLGWMRGFSIAQLGLIPQTQQAPDLIMMTETGHIAVVECTTGHLKSDHKLSLLVQRTAEIKRKMVATGRGHLNVIAVMVTALTGAEVAADVEQAEKLGVLVLTKEALDQAVQTLPVNPVSADQQFQQAREQIVARQARHLAPNGDDEGEG